MPLGPPPQPFHPYCSHRESEPAQPFPVSGDPVVLVVTCHFLLQGFVLHSNGKMPIAATPHRHPLDGSRQPSFGCSPTNHPVPLLALHPVVREAQEVETARRFSSATSRWAKGDHPGLLRVEGQAVLPKPLGQYLHDPMRIFLARQSQNDVVRIPNQES